MPGLEPGPTNPTPLNLSGAPFGPQFDLLELLPPAAADRLRQLRQRSLDLHAIVPQFEQVREASMTKIAAAAELTRLVSHPQDGGFNLPPSAPQVIAAQRTLDKATEAFTRLQEMQQQRASAWQVSSAALSACETLLRDGRPGGTALEAVEVDPKLAKGEKGLLDAIENRRRRVRELRADLHRVESAPYPSAHVKRRVREMVDQLAARGEPDVTTLLEHDGGLVWPTLRVQSEVIGPQRALAFHEAVDVVGLVAHLLKPTLIATLDALVESEADDKAALSHEARQKAEAQVLGDLLSVEMDESALVWRGQSEGLSVEHRADCSPLAVLQVRLVTTAATTGEGSSWMHAWDIQRRAMRSPVGVSFAAPASRGMAGLALPKGSAIRLGEDER